MTTITISEYPHYDGVILGLEYQGPRVSTPTLGRCGFSPPEYRWTYHYPDLKVSVVGSEEGIFFRSKPKAVAFILSREQEIPGPFGFMPSKKPE